jgi:hypothetical protein
MNRALVGLLLLLTSCGYQFGEGELTRNYATISVPFAKGDQQGALTRAVINELATESSLIYVNEGADLELLMAFKEVDETDIGFRYDNTKDNDKNHRVRYTIPDETRLTGYLEINLIDRGQGKVIFGPVLLRATYDFDHGYYASQGGLNRRSLGQVSDYDEAYDAALIPLYQNLARKVVDYLKSAVD